MVNRREETQTGLKSDPVLLASQIGRVSVSLEPVRAGARGFNPSHWPQPALGVHSVWSGMVNRREETQTGLQIEPCKTQTQKREVWSVRSLFEMVHVVLNLTKGLRVP